MMVMLIHPDTGDVQTITKSTDDPRGTFDYLVRAGYNPVGPKAQALAARIRTV